MINIIRRLLRHFKKTDKNIGSQLPANLIINGDDVIPEFVIKSSRYLLNLQKFHEVVLTLVDGELLVTIQDIIYSITTQEEAYILNEVFKEGVYNFDCSCDCVVIDIGMNVGISSLFFAKKPNISLVIGYEPLKPTYDRAIKNIGLNPSISAKILPVNLGLGLTPETKVVDYVEDLKGSVSVTDDPHFKAKDATPNTKEVVSIVSAKEVLRRIRDDYPGSCLVCKMDCEGSEYDIFHSLALLDVLLLPDIFMVEWHYKGKQEIEDFLLGRNYSVFAIPAAHSDIGMLYASRLAEKFSNSN